MADYLIIDAHVHTYPTREIGLQAKGDSNATDYAGTLDELLPLMERAGISKVVMVNFLPTADMRDAALAKLPGGLSQTEREEALKEIDARMVGRVERKNSWTCSQSAHKPPSVTQFSPTTWRFYRTELRASSTRQHLRRASARPWEKTPAPGPRGRYERPTT